MRKLELFIAVVLIMSIAFSGCTRFAYPSIDLYKPEVRGSTVEQNGAAFPVCGDIDEEWCKALNPDAAGDGPFEFRWGDGYVSCSWFPAEHSYAEGGAYKISVRVKNTCGLISESTTSAFIPTETQEGVKIETSDNMLELNEDLSEVIPRLDYSDLPNLLAKGNFEESEGDYKNDVDYVQEIYLDDGSVRFTEDEDEVIGDYLVFPDHSGSSMYTYKLLFDEPVKYNPENAADDLIGAEIEMLNSEYMITDTHSCMGVIDKLTLFRGSLVMWLHEGQTMIKQINGIGHNITMLDVCDDEGCCGISVDGTTVLRLSMVSL
jgi:hypothetical protein